MNTLLTADSWQPVLTLVGVAMVLYGERQRNGERLEGLPNLEKRLSGTQNNLAALKAQIDALPVSYLGHMIQLHDTLVMEHRQTLVDLADRIERVDRRTGGVDLKVASFEQRISFALGQSGGADAKSNQALEKVSSGLALEISKIMGDWTVNQFSSLSSDLEMLQANTNGNISGLHHQISLFEERLIAVEEKFKNIIYSIKSPQNTNS